MKRAWMRGLTAASMTLGAACSGREHRAVESTSAGTVSVAPSADSAAGRNASLVRVVDVLPGAGPIDVFADDQRAFVRLAFREVTAYRSISQDTPTFRVVRAGRPLSSSLAEETAFARDGRYYTLLVLRDAGDSTPRLQLLRDDVTTDSTIARLRVINATARQEKLDIVVDPASTPIFAGLGAMDDAGYRTVRPGTTSVTVRAAGTDSILLRMRALTFEPGERRTVLLAYPSASGANMIAVELTDQLIDRREAPDREP